MLQQVAADAQPCVWMCAGLISYRLCSRDFDCEHCPLDAALRGEPAQAWHGVSLFNTRGTSCTVPEDRWYSAGHTWVQPTGVHSWRLGIDAFAAALLGAAVRVHWQPGSISHERGAELCTIDVGLGFVRIGAPFDTVVACVNDHLEDAPAALITDPYGSGWLVELHGSGDADMSTPEQARSQISMDLRRFRRALAFRLLAEITTQPQPPAELQPINDLRDVIAGDGYVEFLREFVY